MRHIQQVACFAASAAAAALTIALCAVFALTAPNDVPHVASIELAHVTIGIVFSSLSDRNGAGNGFNATAAAAAARPSQDELHAFSARIFHKSQFALQGSNMAQLTANPMRLLDIHHRC